MEAAAIDKDARKMMLEASKYGYIGIFFGIAIVLGYFGGAWLDRKLGTDPYLGMAGLIVGVVAGVRELYRITKQYRKEME